MLWYNLSRIKKKKKEKIVNGSQETNLLFIRMIFTLITNRIVSAIS